MSEETPEFGVEAEQLIAENAFAEGVDWANAAYLERSHRGGG